MTLTDTSPDTLAESFFNAMNEAPALAETLNEADHMMQFVGLGGESFHATVEKGRITFGNGKKYPPTLLEAIYVVEVEPCLVDLLNGRLTLGEAIFDHKIQIPGYRNKEPRIARMSRLLRMGIWQLVPGAPILRPAK